MAKFQIMANIAAHHEIVDLIASLAPERLVKFKFSEEAIARVQDLLIKKNAGEITSDEQAELDYYVFLEKLVGLAKAKAHHLLRAA